MPQILCDTSASQNQPVSTFLLVEKNLLTPLGNLIFFFFQWKRAPALLCDALLRLSLP